MNFKYFRRVITEERSLAEIMYGGNFIFKSVGVGESMGSFFWENFILYISC